MKRAFLLAYPAGHSLSPAMHNAAFAALGLDARYDLREVTPGRLAAAVADLRTPDCFGANVTIPHKLAALALVDTLSDAARVVGAVNTVVNRQGTLIGHNTDAGGFRRALDEARFDPRGRRALLLGAGGAARAVAFALLDAGVTHLAIYNRSPERAAALAASFASLGEVGVVERERLATALAASDLLVNSTSVGMEGGPAPGRSPLSDLPLSDLPRAGPDLVIDLVYRPAPTPLLQDAARAGLAVQDGLPMLVHQGAEALEWWTGMEAPTSVMRAAAQAVLHAER